MFKFGTPLREDILTMQGNAVVEGFQDSDMLVFHHVFPFGTCIADGFNRTVVVNQA